MNITVLDCCCYCAVAGIIVGIGLGLFGEKFKVEVDEKEGHPRGTSWKQLRRLRFRRL